MFVHTSKNLAFLNGEGSGGDFTAAWFVPGDNSLAICKISVSITEEVQSQLDQNSNHYKPTEHIEGAQNRRFNCFNKSPTKMFLIYPLQTHQIIKATMLRTHFFSSCRVNKTNIFIKKIHDSHKKPLSIKKQVMVLVINGKHKTGNQSQ